MLTKVLTRQLITIVSHFGAYVLFSLAMFILAFVSERAAVVVFGIFWLAVLAVVVACRLSDEALCRLRDGNTCALDSVKKTDTKAREEIEVSGVDIGGIFVMIVLSFVFNAGALIGSLIVLGLIASFIVSAWLPRRPNARREC